MSWFCSIPPLFLLKSIEDTFKPVNMEGNDQMKIFDRKRKRSVRKKQELTGRRKKNSPLVSKGINADFVIDGEESDGNATSMDPDLYTAAVEGKILELVQAVEKGPADAELDLSAACIQVSPQKNTVLHIATSYRHHEIVNLICKDLPFFIAEKNSKGDTALHIAARSGDSLLVSLLVNAIVEESNVKAVLGEKNDEGNTALHEALRHHHEKIARILIDKNRDISYSVNEEGKSVLYLAAEAGYVELVRLIMENPLGNNIGEGKIRKMSPVHAAIRGRSIDVLNIMWEKDQSSFHLRCEQGKNPLHCAASIGYFEGVNFLLDRFCGAAYKRDKNGQFPIHIASDKGYIDIIQEFLWHCPDSRELLNWQGQNILHVAAKSGKAHVVNFILKTPILERLVNERDNDGNTPLHLATIYQHPKIVSTLAQDRRVNLKVKNKEGLTAHDIADGYNLNMDTMASFRKRLTWLALRLACAQRSQQKVFKKKRQNLMQSGPSKLENYKDKVRLIFLVSTFIATVTFSAGFTIPGGDNNSASNQGIATLVMEKMFHVFVICNTMAMYSSIMVAVTLIWAQLGDLGLVPFALKLALPLLGVALTMMSIAFMAGLYLVVSKLAWLGNVVLFMGLIFFVALSAVFVPLCFLDSSNYYILRYIFYYPFRLMLFTFGSYNDEELGD